MSLGWRSAGSLPPIRLYLDAPVLLLAIAFACALAYGAIFFKRPPSLLKTVIKTVPVTALALVSWVDNDPWLLTLALALCALGDAFLAGDPKRWLPFGLASFLAGHLAYVALFATAVAAFQQLLPHLVWPADSGAALALNPVRCAAMAAVVLVGAGMLAWLWRSLGGLKIAVSAYVAAILAMVCGSLILPPFNNGAQYGALAFFASDGILSAQLFKQRFTGLAGQWAVWGLYFIGQVLILSAFS